MEYEPAEYQKLAIRQYPARTIRETAEGKYWKRFKAPVTSKQFGAVNHLDFCPEYPYHLAVSAATRVVIYDGHNRQVKKTITRFKDTAFSGVFRSDGKLLAAGGQDGVVQVFDAGSRSVLRQFKSHKRPTHVVRFSPDRLHVLSGSDDVTTRWWDITAGTQVLRLDGHGDYVRAAAVSPANSETWATGGYDHVVKLWDVRSGRAIMTLPHGAPVEDVAFFPAGSLLVSAGGNALTVWDVLSGGRPLKRLTNFQKTVTCVRISPHAGPEASAAPRILTGSIDGHVKVFDTDSFRVTHASRYPSPVTSIGISHDCRLLAVGMADGMLSIRKHDRPKEVADGPGARPQQRLRYRPRLTAANYKYFVRGQSERAAATDYKVAARRKAKLQPYDKMLRAFKYGAALDAALATRQPEVVASVLEELATRGGLAAALAGRDAERLLPLLGHLAKHVSEPRYSRLLVNVAHRALDIYAPVIGISPDVDAKLAQLRDRVREEVRLQDALLQLQGCLDPIMAASMIASLSLTGSGADAAAAAVQ